MVVAQREERSTSETNEPKAKSLAERSQTPYGGQKARPVKKAKAKVKQTAASSGSIILEPEVIDVVARHVTEYEREQQEAAVPKPEQTQPPLEMVIRKMTEISTYTGGATFGE